MQGVRDIIEDRINALGTTEPIIQNLGDDRLVVQIPGAEPSNIELTFSPVPSGQNLRTVLDTLGRSEDSIGTPEVGIYSITAAEPLTPRRRSPHPGSHSWIAGAPRVLRGI